VDEATSLAAATHARLRELRGRELDSLAARAGVARSTVYKFRKLQLVQVVPLAFSTVQKLAKALGVGES
jgi:transcriptional regulator with XRE-family HTH domain